MAYDYTHDVKTDPSIIDNLTVDSGEKELIYTFHITGSITVVKLSGFSGKSNISYDSPDHFTIETSPEGCDYEIRINGTVNFLSKSGTGMENDFNESDKLTNLIYTSSDSSKDARNNNNMLAPHTSSFTSTMITSSLEAIDCLAEGLPNSEEVANSSTLHSGFIPLPEIKAEIGSDFDNTYRSDHTETLFNNSIAEMSTASTHLEPSLSLRPFVDSDALHSEENRHCTSEHSTDRRTRPKEAPDRVQAKGQRTPIRRVYGKNDIIPSHFTKRHPLSCALCGFTCSWKRALQSHLEAHLSNAFDGSVKRLKFRRRKPRKSFTCCLCQKIYKSPLRFACHLQDCHCQDKISPCSVCDFFCEETGSLAEHVQSEHMNLDKYYCYTCSVHFDTLNQLSHHNSVSHAEKKLLPCVLCSFVCSTANGMKEHTLTLHAQRDKSLDLFFCAFCDFSTDAFYRLCRHQKTPHTDKGSFLCSMCGLSFNEIKALKYHEAVHAKEKHQCPKCGFACRSQFVLKAHMKKHYDFRLYACQHCERKFKCKYNLELHILSKHSKTRRFKCPCGTSFKMAYHLKAHVEKNHSTTNPISCSLCSYTTKSINLLKYHRIRMHAKADPYSCPHCDYTCKLQCDLDEHIKNTKHSNEKQKPFQCDHCSFSTTKKSYLKEHFQRRHARKSVACSMCDAIFKTNLCLNNHMGTHPDEKTHSCSVCGISTKTISCLRAHMKKKHSRPNPFACTQCEYAGKGKATLDKHIQLKHTTTTE